MRLEVAKARALLVRLGQAEAAHARELAQHLTDRVEPGPMLIGRARRHRSQRLLEVLVDGAAWLGLGLGRGLALASGLGLG